MARRALFSEGLGEAFDEVTKKLHIERIWSDAEDANVYSHHTLKKQLAMCQPLNPKEGRRDKLTRLNEWLLEIFMAIPWHLELYRSVYNLFVYYSIDRMLVAPEMIHGMHSGSLSRPCMKFWFLDSASILQEAVAPSTIATSDSHATFRPTEDELIQSSVELVSEHSIDEATFNRKSTFQLHLARLIGRSNWMWMDERVELPPVNVDQEDLARAATALEEYQKEAENISRVNA